MKLLLSLSLVLGLSILPGCAPKSVATSPDVPRAATSEDQTARKLQVVKVVNDVTTAVITANSVGKLSDQATAQVLNVNKQILDVLQADRVSGIAKALVIVQNTRQALPENLIPVLTTYMQQLVEGLKGAL